MALHELLAAKRDDIMLRWKAQVQGTLVAESMPTFELVDHLPEFLEEIRAALRADAGLTSVGPTPEESSAAAGHGEQRLRLGFSLDSVVREYGALRTAIVATVIDAGGEVTFRELQVVFDSIITGIAHAVSEYSHQRDAELLRHANEHFAFIAHELRNPLGSAQMAFLLLKKKGQIAAEGRAVGALEQGLQQASELIDQTLNAARVASGIELRREWTTLGALLEDAESGALPEAEAKGVAIRVSIEMDEKVNLDLRLVRSALGNVVRNGVKYTPSEGVVEVRARVSNGRAVLEVEDCCGGLPPGRVEEALSPFVRLDNRQSGFGLGLAIAKQAVNAHGGSIRIQNLPGKGCVFVLELPVVVESTPDP
jgi:signal transduction histidine kinase